MFVFDYCEDLDIATYEYRIYQANQVEADPAHSGYYKLINAATINSGTIAPYSQGFNLSNVFTVAVENSTTTSSSTTTSPISYYGAIRAIDTSANLGPWTLITKTSTDTPLIDQQFIGSLTAAKITTGTLGAAEITLNGANSIIKSSNYSAGSLGWKITGLGDAEFNDLTVRTSLDIGGLDASSFHVDINGNMWLGASTYGSAPFKVSNTGALIATGANISGAITATSGTFTGAINASSGSFTGKITVPGTNTQFGKNINDAANYQGIKVGGLAGEWKNAWVERNDGSVYFNAQNVAGTNRFYMDSTDSLLSMGNGVFSVTNAGAVTASSVTITGGTVGGISTSNTKLFIGTGTYNNANTGFYVDNAGQFSLKDKLSWDGTTLTINGGGTFSGTVQVGDVEIGNDVGPGAGHHGVSLSPNNFNNIFLRRASDGVYFFRVNQGGANSLTFDSASGVLNITGTINASSGSFTGTVTSGGAHFGVMVPGAGYYKGINLSPDSNTQFQSCFLRGDGGEVYLRADNGSQWLKFENGSVQINAVGFSLTGSSANFSGSITGSSITANSSILVGSSTSLGYMQLDVSTDLIVNGMRFQNRQYGGWHNSFYPYTDAQYDLSVVTTPSLGVYRWDNIYYIGSVIDQSDVRTKNSIETSDLGLDFINMLRPVSYFKNAHKKIALVDSNEEYLRDENENILYDIIPGKRRHYGLVAQEVRQVISDLGKTSFDFSGWGQHDPDDPESEQTLTYLEFISPIIKSLQELSAKVDELESRLV